jgi:hypothetical protein
MAKGYRFQSLILTKAHAISSTNLWICLKEWKLCATDWSFFLHGIAMLWSGSITMLVLSSHGPLGVPTLTAPLF